MPDRVAREINDAQRAFLSEHVEEARRLFMQVKSRIVEILDFIEKNDSVEQKDHVYKVAGDHIVAIPEELTALEVALDAVALAQTDMAHRRLKERLPGSVVEEFDQALDLRVKA